MLKSLMMKIGKMTSAMIGIDNLNKADKIKAALLSNVDHDAAFVADTLELLVNKVFSLKLYEDTTYAKHGYPYSISFTICDINEKVSYGIKPNVYVFECYLNLELRILDDKGEVCADNLFPHAILCEVDFLSIDEKKNKIHVGRPSQFYGDFNNLINQIR